MTKHDVGADTHRKVHLKKKDCYKDGFLAKSDAEKAGVPDLKLKVLIGIEDVTDRVNAAFLKVAEDASAAVARPGIMARVEKDSREMSDLRSDVVPRYQRGNTPSLRP